MTKIVGRGGHALALGAAFACLAAAPALAEENWTPHLPGVTEGLAAGALPPPGVYFVNTTMLAAFNLYDNDGNRNGVRADIFVDAPVLLWTPGIKVLGADYGVAIAQPFTLVSAHGGPLSETNWGAFDTIVMPGELSWALPHDFHVSTSLSVYLPDGTAQRSVISYPGGTYAGVPNSINYWALEPSLGLSWLHDGWNVSASLNYDINFKDGASGYTSGDALVGDYTLTKKLGPVTLGLGAYSVNQIGKDHSDDPTIEASLEASGGNRQTKYGAGPILGYDFGPVSVSVTYNHGFGASNVLNDDTVWARILIPLG